MNKNLIITISIILLLIIAAAGYGLYTTNKMADVPAPMDAQEEPEKSAGIVSQIKDLRVGTDKRVYEPGEEVRVMLLMKSPDELMSEYKLIYRVIKDNQIVKSEMADEVFEPTQTKRLDKSMGAFTEAGQYRAEVDVKKAGETIGLSSAVFEVE